MFQFIGCENLVDYIVNGLSDPVFKVQIAAVRCLLSLSRSVQQLRTSLFDRDVCKPLLKVARPVATLKLKIHDVIKEILLEFCWQIMESPNSELLQVASATLCNLVLECSPYKESLIAENVIEVLVNLAEQPDSNLKINGVWGLMVVLFCNRNIIILLH